MDQPETFPVRHPSDEVEYERYVLEKIQRGEDRAQMEGVITQEDVEKSMARWVGK